MLPPQDAGPAIRDLKQTRPTGTEVKPGLGDAIHAVTLSDRRGPRRTRADPPICAAHEREFAVVVAVHNQVLCIACSFGLGHGPGALPGSGRTQP